MSKLFSAIPGLSAHKVEIPEAVIEFDVERAEELLRQVNATIASAYPGDDCFSWLVKQPDVWKPLCDGENDVDLAFLAQDMPTLEKAVDRLERMYLKAFNLYASRPPVVEVQEDLFSGGSDEQ